MTDDVPAICCGGGPVDKAAVSVWDEYRGRNAYRIAGLATQLERMKGELA